MIYIVILNERTDDKGVKSYELQLEGGKTAAEFPGVIDVLTTLTMQPSPSGAKRVLVTQQDNVLGLPAKDRSGKLASIEEPHLGRLIAKCLGQPTPNKRIWRTQMAMDFQRRSASKRWLRTHASRHVNESSPDHPPGRIQRSGAGLA